MPRWYAFGGSICCIIGLAVYFLRGTGLEYVLACVAAVVLATVPLGYQQAFKSHGAKRSTQYLMYASQATYMAGCLFVCAGVTAVLPLELLALMGQTISWKRFENERSNVK